MRRSPLFVALLLACAGCATVPDVSGPVQHSVPVPPFTRVLGQAAVYLSEAGEKLEVVHDASAGIAIIKLPDERIEILPAEIAGSEGRYRNDHMTVWENDGSVLLWIGGKLVFSGRSAK